MKPTPERQPPGQQWRYDARRIWAERDASGRIVMLRHPAHPFRSTWREADGFAGLGRIATAYLAEVWDELKAPAIWLEDVASSVGETRVRLSGEVAETGLPFLRWLPFATSAEDHEFEPRGSTWVTRRNGGDVLDRTALLVGVLSIFKGNGWIALYGHQGIRVVMHVGPARPAAVRVTGLTTTLPHFMLKVEKGGKPAADWEERRREALNDVYANKPVARLAVGEPGWRVYLPGEPPPHASIERFEVPLRKGVRSKRLVLARVPGMQLAAHANVQASVYTEDLMSRYGPGSFRGTRPGRTWEDGGWALGPVRDPRQLDLKQAGGLYELENAAAQPNVRVTYSRFSSVDRVLLASGAVNEDDAKRLSAADLAGSKNRADATTAATAFYHANDLFVRLGRWKLDASEMFRFVKLPLIVRYRYGMQSGSGKDGRSVNAMVLINKDHSHWELELRFGMADLTTSPTRSPLGLACDPRWNWHEFGHVLLAGSVGELEFRFGHSAGDALAAILFDPKSRLAADGNWRFVTFPWVTQPRRRHDREVANGWGWNGALYQRERFFGTLGHCAKAGYWAEQLLSSSLFRLYRGLGGDAAGAGSAAIREAAAEYAAFLISKAIAILGDAASVPASSPDQFVSALVDADAGTANFDDGLFNTGPRSRVGGAARKVIRWAFQQQGLYAPSADGFPTNRPGDQEAVDIHIGDCRNQATEHAPGTYAPIRNMADWQAHPAVMWVRNAADGQAADQAPQAGVLNSVYLSVENLGSAQAQGVTVHLWSSVLGPKGIEDPGLKWKLVGSVGPANIAAGAVLRMGPIDWNLKKAAAGDMLALLAAANCPADQANVDKSTDLPCAFPHPLGHAGSFQIGCPIDQLVSYDNNLGLRLLTLV